MSDFVKQGPYRTINGGHISGRELAGYCWSKKHRGYLLWSDIRSHKCRQKNCCCFQKNADRPMFIQEDFKKQKSNLFRYMRKLYYAGQLTKHKYEKLNHKLNDIVHKKDLEEFIKIYFPEREE